MITIPGIVVGLIILFVTVVCLRRQPIINTSSAANLLKDPSNPKENYLNNNCSQNVNLAGNELKQSSSEWTNSSTIFASINNRALMNQSIYSQPLVLNNNIATQPNDTAHAKPSYTWNINDPHSLDNFRSEGNWQGAGDGSNIGPVINGLTCDLKQISSDTANTESEPAWVEVTNKANQTPSHWVYTDITSTDIAESSTANISSTMNAVGNIFENPFIRSPFLGIPPQTASSSYLVDYSLPKDTSRMAANISSVQSSPLILKRSKELQMSPFNSIYHQYSNRSLNQPKPPSYHSHLSTVSPLRCRSPTALQKRSFNNNSNSRFVNIPPPTSAPPPAPSLNKFASTTAKDLIKTMVPPISTNSRKLIHSSPKVNQLYLSPYSHEFSTIVKTQINGKQSDSLNELYSRPPSEHFYFKINDGKTEFI